MPCNVVTPASWMLATIGMTSFANPSARAWTAAIAAALPFAARRRALAPLGLPKTFPAAWLRLARPWSAPYHLALVLGDGSDDVNSQIIRV